jgi:hypothetical protein
MPASFINDPEHWRQRAEQMRVFDLVGSNKKNRQNGLWPVLN